MYSKPNVLWITVDSIRADRTTMADYVRDTTPHMARIADREEGTAFTDCISHGMWSLPSDASMLTGTYPAQHGTGLWNEVLPADIRTVAERFSDLGYYTAGLSHNSHFSEATGLSRGFDRFEWVHDSNLLRTAGPRILLKYVMRLRSESAGYTAPFDHHRSDYISIELVDRWLKSFENRNEPFFLFVHMLGAHIPYVPPLSYRHQFFDDLDIPVQEAVDMAYDRSINYYREIARGCDFDPQEKAVIDAAYDSLLRYVDRKVGDLFGRLRSHDFGPTVFLVTADHGDLLGEHGIISHQFSLHDGIINVPMIVHGFPSLAELPDDTLIQHMDVMRALLVEAGADDADLEGMEGIDPRTETRDFALSQRGNETFETALGEVRKHDPEFPVDRFHPGVLHSVRSQQYKFLRSDRAEEMYELPDETTDKSETLPEIVRSHRSYLDDMLGSFDTHQSSRERELSDAMREQLSDLGYVVE